MFGSLAAGPAGAAEEGKVQCMGANSCKGQNACKGQGFVEVSSQEECDEAKAKIEEEKPPEQPQ